MAKSTQRLAAGYISGFRFVAATEYFPSGKTAFNGSRFRPDSDPTVNGSKEPEREDYLSLLSTA
jgi:hypothetical protein